MSSERRFWHRFFSSVALVSCCLGGIAQAKTLVELSATAKKTTVFLTVEYVDHLTNTVKRQTGSGVIISENGDVLTASHVVKVWQAQTDEEKQDHRIVGRIGDIHASRSFDMMTKDVPDNPDIALLQFFDQTDPYPTANVCFIQRPATGSTLTAFGFPDHGNFTPATGSFSNAGGDGGLWQVGVPLTEGMSGGPVYDPEGNVVGLVKGAIDFNANVGFVVPVAWSRGVLQARAGVDQKCLTQAAQPQIPANSEVNQTCNEVLFSDMSVSPPRFEKRTICQ
ncbi:serine protease [Mesorhizobium sp. M00.F.Ca.ET.186.01.1.1]|nr:serine protease [bacterium M00.F.Ca.ET.205.01.1.1]TGU54525.1 serine protease [bacterium M00.F.Ca.ET.152.01.1.1]TGV38690.1 serine protease [Mesorhizobium sp. M00.F.Ca.ET.186.01.1.1]TGZ44097.1 serine protease [bacterium M00.F.Ca.ET.162.01.1.1]